MHPNPLSYRDPRSGVELHDDYVERVFRGIGADDFEAFLEGPLYSQLVDEHKIVPFQPDERSQHELRGKSPRLLAVTYPYEWSFSMLKDAALLTLELTERCLEAGFELRDASAFNIVFSEGQPVWVDLGSFGRRRAGIWQAYAQFLDHFVNPLAAASYSGQGIASEWSSLDGLSAALARKRTTLWFLARHGLMRHIVLRARLLRSAERKPTAHVSIADGPKLPTAALLRIVRRLRKSIAKLEPNFESHWATYENHNSYVDSEGDEKEQVLGEWAGLTPRQSVAIDVGTNTGRYAITLARRFTRVLAIDSDEAAIDLLYQRIRSDEVPRNVYPIVADVLNPSGPRGLMHRERLSWNTRFGQADLVVWLAVVHHLVVGRNLPIGHLVELMQWLGNRHVVEVPDRTDPMVGILNARRVEEANDLSPDLLIEALGHSSCLLTSRRITATRSLLHINTC